MKLIYMDKSIILISQRSPELLKSIIEKGFEEVKQGETSYFKMNES